MPLVSVIIPAYNAERSLERTVRSVLAQTLPDLEVWIVDDGSTDGTPALADRLAAADSRVRVLHQTNQRAYAARINALKRSTAPYFAFVDADDTLEPQMYERLYKLAEKHDLDVVQCERSGHATGKACEFFLSHAEVNARYAVPVLIEGHGACFAWDKLYRRHLAAFDFERSNILMSDDMKLNLQIFSRVNRMAVLHEGLYCYEINAGSSVSNFKRRNVDDLREIIETRARWAAAYGIAADDVRLAQWIVKNARNFIISACAARADGFRVRTESVRAILAQDTVRAAVRRLKGGRAEGLWLVRFGLACPMPLVVCAVRLMKAIAKRKG